MTRKSRVLALVAVVTLPMLAACSGSPTAPAALEIRKDGTNSPEFVGMGCGDYVPWGLAPCIIKQN